MQQENTAMVILASGFAVITAILIIQYVSISHLSSTEGMISVSQQQSKAFERTAIPIFVTVTFAIFIILVGVRKLLCSWRSVEPNQTATRIKRSIAEAVGRHRAVFWLGLSIYSIIFLFASNSVVYSSEGISERFGVSIPSFVLIGCCGQPGSFPVVTVYASEHFGFLLVPTNVLLVSFLPLLVGINASLLVNQIKQVKQRQCMLGDEKNKALSYAGISIGLFAGCPACAGNFLVSAIGIGGLLTGTTTVAAVTTLSGPLVTYQPILILGSIVSLLAAIVINGRKHKDSY